MGATGNLLTIFMPKGKELKLYGSSKGGGMSLQHHVTHCQSMTEEDRWQSAPGSLIDCKCKMTDAASERTWSKSELELQMHLRVFVSSLLSARKSCTCNWVVDIPAPPLRKLSICKGTVLGVVVEPACSAFAAWQGALHARASTLGGLPPQIMPHSNNPQSGLLLLITCLANV